jgi:hypothetical protein
LAIFGSTSGELQYYSFTEEKGLYLLNSPYLLEKKDNPFKKREEAGDDMGNLLAGLRDLVMNENEPKLSCFKYFPKSGLIGCGLHPDLGGGVVTIRGDLQKLTFAERHNHDIERAIRSKEKTPAAP